MWAILIPIIAKYGIEFAYKLWANIKAGGEPTQAQWDELTALSKKTYEDYINEAKTNAS